MDRLCEIADELEKMHRELDTADHTKRQAMIRPASMLAEEMAALLRERSANSWAKAQLPENPTIRR